MLKLRLVLYCQRLLCDFSNNMIVNWHRCELYHHHKWTTVVLYCRLYFQLCEQKPNDSFLLVFIIFRNCFFFFLHLVYSCVCMCCRLGSNGYCKIIFGFLYTQRADWRTVCIFFFIDRIICFFFNIYIRKDIRK